MKKTTLAIALTMSLAAASAQAQSVAAPAPSSNDDRVLIGALVVGLAFWLLAGKGSAGLSMSTKNADKSNGTGSGKVLQKF